MSYLESFARRSAKEEVSTMQNHLTRREVLKAAGVGAFTTQLFTGRLRGANDRIAIGFSV